MRLHHVILILASSLLVSCTFRSLAIRNVDWIIERQFDSLFDLNDKQEESLEPKIQDLVSYLKGPIGKQAVDTIDQVMQDSQDGLSEKEIQKAMNSILQMRQLIMERYASKLAAFLVNLNQSQLQHYADAQKERDEDLIEVLKTKDFKDAEESSLKERIDLLTNWYGELNAKQIELLMDGVTATESRYKERLDYRNKSTAFFVSLAQKSEKEITTILKAWAVNPSYRAKQLGFESMTRWQDRVLEFLVNFHKTLSQKQWQHFRGELASLREDIQSFIRS